MSAGSHEHAPERSWTMSTPEQSINAIDEYAFASSPFPCSVPSSSNTKAKNVVVSVMQPRFASSKKQWQGVTIHLAVRSKVFRCSLNLPLYHVPSPISNSITRRPSQFPVSDVYPYPTPSPRLLISSFIPDCCLGSKLYIKHLMIRCFARGHDVRRAPRTFEDSRTRSPTLTHPFDAVVE